METASPYTTKKNLSDNMKHFFYKGPGAISAKIGSTSDVDKIFIRTFCILKKMAISAFHYLTLLVRCEELDAHINYLYLFLKSTYCEYIFGKLFFMKIMIKCSGQ
jgi:hypothetical protein